MSTWLLADNQGTIRDVAQYDSLSGTTGVVNHVQYDSFGNITSQSDPTKQPLLSYTGRQWDADAGLYYYRARWYDPATGRFLSQDPIGFAAGDANLYRYVSNSPTNHTDPTGLQQTPPPISGDDDPSADAIKEALDAFNELAKRALREHEQELRDLLDAIPNKELLIGTSAGVVGGLLLGGKLENLPGYSSLDDTITTPPIGVPLLSLEDDIRLPFGDDVPLSFEAGFSTRLKFHPHELGFNMIGTPSIGAFVGIQLGDEDNNLQFGFETFQVPLGQGVDKFFREITEGGIFKLEATFNFK